MPAAAAAAPAVAAAAMVAAAEMAAAAAKVVAAAAPVAAGQASATLAGAETAAASGAVYCLASRALVENPLSPPLAALQPGLPAPAADLPLPAVAARATTAGDQSLGWAGRLASQVYCQSGSLAGSQAAAAAAAAAVPEVARSPASHVCAGRRPPLSALPPPWQPGSPVLSAG